MSDVDNSIKETMVILAPLKKSDEIKSILLEKKLFRQSLKPRRFSDKLAMPIIDDYGNIFDNIDKPVVRWDRMDEEYTLFTLDSLKNKDFIQYIFI